MFGLAGDQNIKRTYRRALSRQAGANFTRGQRISSIKIEDDEIGEKQPKRFQIVRDFLALVGTEMEFVSYHRADAYSTRFDAIQPRQDRIRPVADQRDHRVRIEQILDHWNIESISGLFCSSGCSRPC